MGQLTQNVIFFNDSVGNIAPASRHFFYEAGTSTPKAVYSDPELTTPIDQPVLADSAGFLPQIWLESGAYRWVGEYDDSSLFFDRDNINLAETTILTSAAFSFQNENDLANLFLANGEPANPQDNQTVETQGSLNQFDGGGRQFVVGPSDLGSGIFLANGKWANPLSNYISPVGVDSKISDHNVSGTAHTDIRNQITNDIASHNVSGTAHTDIRNQITSDISSHNVSGSAHNDIRNQITNDIAAHNTSGTAHNDIRTDVTNNFNSILDLSDNCGFIITAKFNPFFSTGKSASGFEIQNGITTGVGKYRYTLTAANARILSIVINCPNGNIGSADQLYTNTLQGTIDITIRNSSGVATDTDHEISISFVNN